MQPIIEVKNLKYKYDDVDSNIIDNISLEIFRGEKIAIVGSNGSGKSTFIRLLNGLLTKISGEINVAGIMMTTETLAKIRSKIGMVFQNPDNQFVGSTVENDIAFGLENKGIDYEKMHQRVNEMLEKVDMMEFKTKEPAQLSGGQKQRVAIASVMAMMPEILILDEATSMLDPKGRADIFQLILKLQASQEITLIMVTHELSEILQMDRVIVLDEGKIVLDGTPRDLFNYPNLEQYGLIKPFTEQVKSILSKKGLNVEETYQTEGEFLEWLKLLNSTM